MRNHESEPIHTDKIVLMKDGEKMAQKADEYLARLKDPRRNDKVDKAKNWYKYMIADALYKRTEIEKEIIKEELSGHRPMNEELFNDAWGVIKDYATTGGANNKASTGYGVKSIRPRENIPPQDTEYGR